MSMAYSWKQVPSIVLEEQGCLLPGLISPLHRQDMREAERSIAPASGQLADTLGCSPRSHAPIDTDLHIRGHPTTAMLTVGGGKASSRLVAQLYLLRTSSCWYGPAILMFDVVLSTFQQAGTDDSG